MSDTIDTNTSETVMTDTFYAPNGNTDLRQRAAKKPAKDQHYKVICISLYKEDLSRLDAKVKALKADGHRKMNRSALIRFALDQVDLTSLPKSY